MNGATAAFCIRRALDGKEKRRNRLNCHHLNRHHWQREVVKKSESKHLHAKRNDRLWNRKLFDNFWQPWKRKQRDRCQNETHHGWHRNKDDSTKFGPKTTPTKVGRERKRLKLQKVVGWKNARVAVDGIRKETKREKTAVTPKSDEMAYDPFFWTELLSERDYAPGNFNN